MKSLIRKKAATNIAQNIPEDKNHNVIEEMKSPKRHALAEVALHARLTKKRHIVKDIRT